MLKSMALASSSYERAIRLLSAVSLEQVPFEALLQAPNWQLQQMGSYIEAWDGQPLPSPLADWEAAKLAAAQAAVAQSTE
jgi:hypothetical protein